MKKREANILTSLPLLCFHGVVSGKNKKLINMSDVSEGIGALGLDSSDEGWVTFALGKPHEQKCYLECMYVMVLGHHQA